MARFSGDPVTIWADEPGPDRGMTLVEEFWFEDRAGKRWRAAAGVRVDGASIPQPLWALVGSPYTGDYRRASIVHDAACEDAGDGAARRAADRMFFEACREGGCSPWEATVLYVGVRIGSTWSEFDGHPAPSPKLYRVAAEQEVEQIFLEVSQRVLSRGETDDSLVVERWTDEAFGAQASRVSALARFRLAFAPPQAAAP